jgi:dTMP kinase
MFIVLEGLDAAGKATQSKLLAEKIRQEGREVQLESFPRYGTPLGQMILNHLKGERIEFISADPFEDATVLQCMMLADKYDANAKIRQQLHQGTDVIADRWSPSAYCYGVGDGLSSEWLWRTQLALEAPDLCIFIDVPPEVAFQRRPEVRDRYEKDREKQTRIREAYSYLWEVVHGQNTGWVSIDGRGSIEEVRESIWNHVVSRRRQIEP